MPSIAVVISTLNSASTLATCLESIVRSCPRTEMELIVVDGGSRDNTAEIASGFGAKLLVRPGTSAGAARNDGVREASAEIVAFTDSDAVVTAEWLPKIVSEMLADSKLDAIGGLDLGLPGESSIAKAVSSIGLLRRQREEYGWKAVYRIRGVNSAYTRRSFLELGGFDKSLFYGEESELNARMVSQGKKVKYSPELFVYHRRHAQNLASLSRSFKVSRLMAPLLFRPWTLRAALHDATSPCTTLLFLFIAAIITIPLVAFVLMSGHVFILFYLAGLVISSCFAYSVLLIQRMGDVEKLSVFMTVMWILPIQSFLRALGVTVGALELCGRWAARH